MEVGVLVANGTTQQEGGDGQDETHQGGDHAHVANDVQGEIPLSGRRYTAQRGTDIPLGRKKELSRLLTGAERPQGHSLPLTLRVN